MTEKTLYIVQPFERRGRMLVAGEEQQCRSEREALARARHGASTVDRILAMTMVVDDETGDVVGEPWVLARLGPDVESFDGK